MPERPSTCPETGPGFDFPLARERKLQFPFGFVATVVLRRQRKPRCIVFRDEDFVVIEEADHGDLELAYRVEHPHLRKRLCFDVFRYRGRLWWPAFRPYGREQPDERRSLIDALAGRINLFGENLLRPDTSTLDQVFVREFVSGDRDRLHAEMQKKAQDYLLVGDRLFVAGGVPIVVLTDSGPRMVSTGGARTGEVVARESRSIETWGHAEYWADCDICSDTCRVPGVPPPVKEVLGLRRPGTRIPTVQAINPEPVDLFQLRVDAAFRVFRCRLLAVTAPDRELHDVLLPLFERAHPHDAPQLTRRRITALSRSLTSCGTDWFLQRLGTSAMQCILGLMETAARSPEFSAEENPWGDTENELSAEDEAALLELVKVD